MDKVTLYKLLDNYKNNQIISQDKDTLIKAIADKSNAELIKEWISEQWDLNDFLPLLSEQRSEKIFEEILGEIDQKNQKNYNPIFKYSTVAASILIFIAASFYIWFNKPNKISDTQFAKNESEVTDIKAPDINRARITLANGNSIILDSAENTEFLNQNGVTINRLEDGTIEYKGISNEIVLNTITNPKGSKSIALVLNDGTKITLNAASSITYPISFNGKERSVELIGEAYFNVKHSENNPFIVKINNNGEVKVLGTAFNIKAYQDESSIKVTLVDGKVKFANSINPSEDNYVALKPGEQGIIDSNGLIYRREVDVKEFVAWMDDMFCFNDTDLESIMNSLSRWYDVEVSYSNEKLKTLVFGAIITRKSNISSILKLLKMTGTVDFEITDNKIIVK